MPSLIPILILFITTAAAATILPSSYNFNLPVTNLTNPSGCFSDPTVHPFRTSISACIPILRTQLPEYPPNEPLSFGQRTTCMIRVPKIMREGTCGLILSIENPEEEEWASISEVRVAATRIVNECVRGNKHLGGQGWVGRNGKLGVSVLGVRRNQLQQEENRKQRGRIDTGLTGLE